MSNNVLISKNFHTVVVVKYHYFRPIPLDPSKIDIHAGLFQFL
jgi:hypothetical protein